MSKQGSDLERLLRAARGETARAEMPFGFDTRVIALWKSHGAENGWNVVRLFRRVALLAVVVATSAGAAAWWQLDDNNDPAESFSNSYAIADNAIESDALE